MNSLTEITCKCAPPAKPDWVILDYSVVALMLRCRTCKYQLIVHGPPWPMKWMTPTEANKAGATVINIQNVEVLAELERMKDTLAKVGINVS